jgi:hypothetical protein
VLRDIPEEQRPNLNLNLDLNFILYSVNPKWLQNHRGGSLKSRIVLVA